MFDNKYRQKCLGQKINACNVCGTSEGLVVHHINGDRSDNGLENLVPLCGSCHKKVHRAVDPDGAIAELQDELPDSSVHVWESPDETTTIEISKDTWKCLNQRKEPGKTFNDVVSELLEDDNGN